MIRPVFRMQAADGRGPFRPGVTRLWADPARLIRLPTFLDEFGTSFVRELQMIIDRDGGVFGCGVIDSAGIDAWFSRTEQKRLITMGYQVVCLRPDRIIRESENQVVFWRRKPLRFGAEVVGRDAST